MRAVIQRVKDCSVTVEHELVSEMQQGILVYVGVEQDDTEDDVAYLAKKIPFLRIYEDSDGKMNVSLTERKDHEMMVISQFTLIADTRKGRRPSYSNAALPEKALSYYNLFIKLLKKMDISVKYGRFQAHMGVSYTNDGPVTILIDSKKTF